MPRTTATVPRRHTVAPHEWGASAHGTRAGGPPAHARRRPPRTARARPRGACPARRPRRVAGVGRPDAPRGPARIGHRGAVVAPGRGRAGRPRRSARRRQHGHGVGQEPRLPPADPQRPRRGGERPERSRRDRALPLPHQGARRRPAEPHRPARAAGGAARDLRRRHPDRRAPLDPRPRQPRAHQPGPAPPLAAARARALELVPARAALRRRRRVPRLQGRLRRAHGGGAAAAAAGRRALPLGADLRLRVRHGGRPRGARLPPARYAGDPGDAGRVAPRVDDVRPVGAAAARRRDRAAAARQHHHRDGRAARRVRARARADGRLRAVARRGGGRGAHREGAGLRRRRGPASPPTAAASCPRSVASSSARCAPRSCSASRRRTRSSSGST